MVSLQKSSRKLLILILQKKAERKIFRNALKLIDSTEQRKMYVIQSLAISPIISHSVLRYINIFSSSPLVK